MMYDRPVYFAQRTRSVPVLPVGVWTIVLYFVRGYGQNQFFDGFKVVQYPYSIWPDK